MELREYVEAGDTEIALQLIDGHLALIERTTASDHSQ